MLRSSRIKKRLDYQLLLSCGEKVDKVEEISELSLLFEEISLGDNMDNLLIQIESVADDIEDFIDENPSNQFNESKLNFGVKNSNFETFEVLSKMS